jgi:hypothetical protein
VPRVDERQVRFGGRQGPSEEIRKLAEEKPRNHEERDEPEGQREQHRHEDELRRECPEVADLEPDVGDGRVDGDRDDGRPGREVTDGRQDERAGDRRREKCPREDNRDQAVGAGETEPLADARTRDELGSELVGTQRKSRRAIDSGHAVLEIGNLVRGIDPQMPLTPRLRDSRNSEG